MKAQEMLLEAILAFLAFLYFVFLINLPELPDIARLKAFLKENDRITFERLAGRIPKSPCSQGFPRYYWDKGLKSVYVCTEHFPADRTSLR